MRLARIATAGKAWLANDLTGAGAARYPGRWNLEGEYVVYASTTLALAMLETVAHIDSHGLPLNRYVVWIDVPDDVWKARRVLKEEDLPRGWDAIPHGMASTQVGSDWYNANQEALLELPSAIVPEESIVLINAKHKDAKRLKATTGRRIDYNMVLRTLTET
ncbi:RES family NAD+ phosphorylase [Thermomonas hydrothermalis]|uniref:RES family NAD+ phosphorylase n=1 Tax=Thermomonas hydrothermalis TaxID=213588 RepID=UPI00235708B6|nr:RES family NAD+ phosphorylase [Thermomonas hydrothermalis]